MSIDFHRPLRAPGPAVSGRDLRRWPPPVRPTSPVPSVAVVVVEHRLGEDGAARSSLRLVDRWQRAGVPVRLVALQRVSAGAPSAPVPSGVTVTHPLGSREPRLRWALLWGVLRAATTARRADVVLSGREIGWGLVVAWVAARLARRPFVAMIRNEPVAAIEQYVPRPLQPVTRRALRGADRLICISPGLVEAVCSLGIDRDKVSVVLNGVDVAAVRAAAAAGVPALAAGAGPLVVGVGRLTAQKGFDVLIRAHARVLAAGRAHRVLLLGEGPERESLTRLAEELGVAETVSMPGFDPNPVATVAAADLYCLPSRWEGFGQTLAEAMIVGTPVVAADCVSGPRDLLDDGTRGDLVPVDDVDALAAAIQRHLRDPGRLRSVAVAGQAWAVSHLDVSRSATELLDVLADEALTRPGRGRRRRR